MKNVFNQADVAEIIGRLDKLTANSQPLWGKMAVGQMLAHCNVTYEMVYDNKHEKPNAFVRLILKLFVKKQVVGDVPYKQNGQTAPQFVIKESKDFAAEKQRLLAYINKTLQLGENHFEGKESLSFGVLSKNEWNTMFYKHLDHHFRQFGV
jgi:hypothetical protein